MKRIFKIGDRKIHEKIVMREDLAIFNEEVVHSVCSTFALAREIEWSSRLFVLEMKDENEEGIGTKLSINHISPALEGERLEFIAEIISLGLNEIFCSVTVKAGERIIATAKTGQKIMNVNKLKILFNLLK